MSQFGDIHYALLCMDKVMERPKGTGFVKFKVKTLLIPKAFIDLDDKFTFPEP